MAQSKLTAFSSANKTWTNDKGQIYYKFNLEFENGDKGDALSAKEQGNYTIGKEYSYEKTSREHNGTTYYSFKGVKSLDAANNWKGGGKSHWDDPVVQKRITKAHAMTKASEYLATKEDQSQVTPEAVEVLADHMFEWCYMSIDIGKTDWHEDLLDRRSCLTNAILQIPIKSLNITSWSSLAQQAEKNYTYLKKESAKQQ